MLKTRLENNQLVLYAIIGVGVLGLVMSLIVVIHILSFMLKNYENATAVSSQQEDTINQAIELYHSQ